MQQVTISISSNILKLSTIENGEFRGVSSELPITTVNNYQVLDISDFTQTISTLLTNLTKKSPRNLSLNFILEPQEVLLRFVTVNKRDGEIEDQIMAELQDKLAGAHLTDLYFSYKKIAPFVYQLIGVKKEILDKYIQITNKLGTSLNGIFPWPMLFPKLIGLSDPAIFISKMAGEQVVALTEFGGIFFLGTYETDKTTEELQKLVKDLSTYKRMKPINKVYIYNYESFSLNPDYQIQEVKIPNSENQQALGYELHLLLEHLVTMDKSLVLSMNNLLTLLPLPVVQKKETKALVYVGAMSAFLLFIGITAVSMLTQKDGQSVLDNKNMTTEVLSENTSNEEQKPVEAKNEPPTAIQEVLKREDLNIRVENGAGVAGIAGKTQTFLEKLGYKIEGIGNSDVVGRTKTLIKLKADKEKYKDLLTTDMKDNFQIEIETNLETAEKYDVLVVVGTDAKL